MASHILGMAAVMLVMFAAVGEAVELAGPVALLAGGRPLDVELQGCAAPCMTDFDGDGRKDLLVGEPYMGRLRIYRNLGTTGRPRFERFSVFHDGAPEGRVPAT